MGKYQKGEIISGIVTGIEKYGIFVSLDNRVTGLIHISEVSDSFVRNVGDYAELNETIHAKVIDYDSKHKKLKLSIKNLHYRKQFFLSRGNLSRIFLRECRVKKRGRYFVAASIDVRK